MFLKKLRNSCRKRKMKDIVYNMKKKSVSIDIIYSKPYFSSLCSMLYPKPLSPCHKSFIY